MKWMRRCLAALLLAGVGVIAALLVYRHLALPIAEGRLRVEGLRAGLQIERDAQGVPTIRAASIDDAWFGLGFVHAQDRLWQLETHRRIGAGRLAEAFGPRAVESDRFLRALGVRRAAQDQFRLSGYISNVTDKAYSGKGFINDSVNLRYLNNPRTYGLQFAANF